MMDLQIDAKIQYCENLKHQIILLDILSRFLLILQTTTTLGIGLPILMCFDMLFIFVYNINFSGDISGIIIKSTITFLYHTYIGKFHISSILCQTLIYIVIQIVHRRFYHCGFLLLSIIVHGSLVEGSSYSQTFVNLTLLLLGVCILTISDQLVRMTRTEVNFKQEFITIASHELRNPLQALSFLITYLDSFEMTRKQKEIIEDIKSTVKLLISIIDNVLDIAKMSSGKMTVKNVRMNLVEVVERIASIYYQKAMDKQLGLYADIDSSIPAEVYGDPVLLSQILSNFTSNAIKFTREGRIVLSVKLLEKVGKKCYFKISCNDTGIGITSENQKDLFQPFKQVESGIQHENQGWGLGLAIGNDISTLLGCKIELESIPGVGSTFSFLLPMEEASINTVKDLLQPIFLNSVVIVVRDEEGYLILKKYLQEMNVQRIQNGLAEVPVSKDIDPDSDYLLIDQKMIEQNLDLHDKFTKVLYIGEVFDQTSRVLNEPICYLNLNRFLSIDQRPDTNLLREDDISNMSILVVDDNILINRFEVNLLQRNGVKMIKSAYDGIQALSLINEFEPFDVILMDIQMPKMDGIETTKKIRQHNDPHKSRIPVIIVTGNTLFDTPACLAIGANAVLSKPVNFNELILMIHKVHLGIQTSKLSFDV